MEVYQLASTSRRRYQHPPDDIRCSEPKGFNTLIMGIAVDSFKQDVWLLRGYSTPSR
jgi:hypothetical protein